MRVGTVTPRQRRAALAGVPGDLLPGGAEAARGAWARAVGVRRRAGRADDRGVWSGLLPRAALAGAGGCACDGGREA